MTKCVTLSITIFIVVLRASEGHKSRWPKHKCTHKQSWVKQASALLMTATGPHQQLLVPSMQPTVTQAQAYAFWVLPAALWPQKQPWVTLGLQLPARKKPLPRTERIPVLFALPMKFSAKQVYFPSSDLLIF